jgi:hypothetical protein
MRTEVKRITIRVSPALHQQLHQTADEQSVSLNTLVVKALETYVKDSAAGQGRLSLQDLSDLLSPVAEAGGLSEEELLQHARQVRRRIWQERYAQAVQALVDQDAP